MSASSRPPAKLSNDELKNICVWTKTTPGQGSFYRSQHEFVLVFKHGHGPHLNNFQLGQHGRSRSNVWHYPGVNTFRAGRMDELRMHPTVKPVALIWCGMTRTEPRAGQPKPEDGGSFPKRTS